MSILSLTSTLPQSGAGTAGNGDPQYILSIIEEEATPLFSGTTQNTLFSYALFGISAVLLVLAVVLYLYRCRKMQRRIRELRFREKITEERIDGKWWSYSLKKQIAELEMHAAEKICTN